MILIRSIPMCFSCSHLPWMKVGARHVVIRSLTNYHLGTIRRCRSMNAESHNLRRQSHASIEPSSGVRKPADQGKFVARASSYSAEQPHAISSGDPDEEGSAMSITPIVLLWISLGMLAWCTQRLAAPSMQRADQFFTVAEGFQI